MGTGESKEEDYGKYGNIMKVETTGASKTTAGYDNLKPGVDASNTMAEMDLEEMEKFRSIINKVADEYEIDPALIAAIISRESRAGKGIAAHGGWGDNYKAWGLMQVDVTEKGGNHKPVGGWGSVEHLRQGTGILVEFIDQIHDKFPNWCKEQQLKGGIAAYNVGPRKVESYRGVDQETTGGDYSNDVVARAKWYKNHGDF